MRGAPGRLRDRTLAVALAGAAASLLLPAVALAATASPVSSAAPASAPARFDYAHAPKFALVVGNRDYAAWPRLRNAVADAQLMGQTLSRLGYRTEVLENADRAALQQALSRLTDQLRGGGVGLFYFAGHGVQVQRANYLLPTSTGAYDAQRLPAQALPVDELLRQLRHSGAQASLVLLDACRDDPSEATAAAGARGRPRWRGASQEGFAEVAHAAPGMLVAYATQPGERAQDGAQGHSPFAEALSRWLPEPGLPLSLALDRVQRDVRAKTLDEQRPLIESSLAGDFALAPGPAVAGGNPNASANADSNTNANARPGLQAPAPLAGNVPARTVAGGGVLPLLWFQRPDQAALMDLTHDILQRAQKLNADDLPRLEHQARHGSVVAQAVLGTAWRQGFGVGQQQRRSGRQAQAWLRMAAQQAMPYAQNELAEMLYRGEGGERRTDEARRLFDAAARQGYTPARLNLLQVDLEQGGGSPEVLQRALQGLVR